jgi:hypothetical protein
VAGEADALVKYRVERERTDHGYGKYWIVMNDEGDVVWPCAPSWRRAMHTALQLAGWKRAVA